MNKCFKKTATREITPSIAAIVLTSVIPYWLGHVSAEENGLHTSPLIDDKLWRKAQLFSESNPCNLAFKATASMCNAQCTVGLPCTTGVAVPSMKTYNSVASIAQSIEEQRELLHDRAMRFRLLMRAPTDAGVDMEFHEFIDMAYAFFILYELPEDMRSSPEVHYACTCPMYSHYLVCKHSLGYGIATGAVSVPVMHDATMVGALPKRGRPKKVVSMGAW